MNSHKSLLPVMTGLLFASATYAQVDITLDGSTAFRSIAFDRAASLFDPGFVTKGNTGLGPGTYVGTMSNTIPSLGSTPVTLRLSFSGSATGMQDVDQEVQVGTADPVTGSTVTNTYAMLAFSDVFPESASLNGGPTLNGGDFQQWLVGVIPFVFVRNTLPGSSLIACTNITKEQAYYLMQVSGVLPCSFIGGSSAAPVYLTGRDHGSGTRITTQLDVEYIATPTLWITNGVSTTLISTNEGYSSGGLERGLIANYTNVIGYLGLADAGAISASAGTISYEGVPYTAAAVQGGTYPLWGYEHFVNKLNPQNYTLTANMKLVEGALLNAITNQTYQTSNPLYTGNFVDQVNMKVHRGSDGGPIQLN